MRTVHRVLKVKECLDLALIFRIAISPLPSSGHRIVFITGNRATQGKPVSCRGGKGMEEWDEVGGKKEGGERGKENNS